MTDANGNTPTPSPTPGEQVQDLLDGAHRIADVAEAAAYLGGDAADGLLEVIEPIGLLLLAEEMFAEVIKAMETEERGCGLRGWCYSVLYGALDMGSPPEPTFQGSLGGEDQDGLDRTSWREGVSSGLQSLSNGADGVFLSNKLILRAHDGDPAETLNRLWQAACAQGEDAMLVKAYPTLSWPEPTGA